MKLHDILVEDQINEVSLKQAISAGIVGSALLGSPMANKGEEFVPARATSQIHKKSHRVNPPTNEFAETAKQIAAKYKIEYKLALEIVQLAQKYKKPGFPSAEDILAIVGIESSFNPDAKSGLSKDPAVGLMQIRPGVWDIPAETLKDPEENIKYGSAILHKYYKKLKNPEDAIQAYNIGITNFRNGVEAPRYLNKYNREISNYTT